MQSSKEKSNEELITEITKEREQLKIEIESLKVDLQISTSREHESREIISRLEEQKEELKRRADDIEFELKTNKNELEEVTKAFNHLHNIQKKSAYTNIEQEDQYLQETAEREASFKTRLYELQKDLKQVRNELDRLKTEKERLIIDNQDLQKRIEASEHERKLLKNDLKELKQKDAYLQKYVDELDAENTNLQKTVANLKSSQIDFEGAKYEVNRLKEELEERRSQVEDYEALKNIAEKQVKFFFVCFKIKFY